MHFRAILEKTRATCENSRSFLSALSVSEQSGERKRQPAPSGKAKSGLKLLKLLCYEQSQKKKVFPPGKESGNPRIPEEETFWGVGERDGRLEGSWPLTSSLRRLGFP